MINRDEYKVIFHYTEGMCIGDPLVLPVNIYTKKEIDLSSFDRTTPEIRTISSEVNKPKLGLHY